MLQYMLNAHYLDRYDPNEILNYGCWCQTNPDHINHRRGTPVDSVDRKCQNWYRCQRCVSMDTFGQCSASEVIWFKRKWDDNLFQQIYSVYFDPTSKSFVCSSTNTDCQNMACECDAAFVNSIIFSLNEFNRRGLLILFQKILNIHQLPIKEQLLCKLSWLGTFDPVHAESVL